MTKASNPPPTHTPASQQPRLKRAPGRFSFQSHPAAHRRRHIDTRLFFRCWSDAATSLDQAAKVSSFEAGSDNIKASSDGKRGGEGVVERGGRRRVYSVVHSVSRMTIDPRIPTLPGRSTSGFHQSGRHCLHQARSAVRCSASPA